MGINVPMKNIYQCLQCGVSISEGVSEFSRDIHGVPLCFTHQRWIEESFATDEAIAFYFALKSNQVPVVLEYKEGGKTIDIAVPGKLYIELENKPTTDSEKDLNDLLTTFKIWKEEVPTVRIPNSLVYNHHQFKVTVNRLTEMCMDLRPTG